jgi:hypothetical protein
MIDFNKYKSRQLKEMIEVEIMVYNGYAHTYSEEQKKRAKENIKIKREVLKSRRNYQ